MAAQEGLRHHSDKWSHPTLVGNSLVRLSSLLWPESSEPLIKERVMRVPISGVVILLVVFVVTVCAPEPAADPQIPLQGEASQGVVATATQVIATQTPLKPTLQVTPTARAESVSTSTPRPATPTWTHIPTPSVVGTLVTFANCKAIEDEKLLLLRAGHPADEIVETLLQKFPRDLQVGCWESALRLSVPQDLDALILEGPTNNTCNQIVDRYKYLGSVDI